EVRLPGGAQVKPGSEMLVSLTNLSADIDVAILSQLPTEANTAWNKFAWNKFAWNKFAFGESDSSVLAWNKLASPGNTVESIDVDLAELGLSGVGGDDIQVADFSANRGLDDETAWARAATPGASFYVAVFTSDGEQSTTPSTLAAEIIQQP